eukprot:141296_1
MSHNRMKRSVSAPKSLVFPLKIPPINLTVPKPQALPAKATKQTHKTNTKLPPFPSKHQSIDDVSQPSLPAQSFNLTIPTPTPAPDKRIRGVTCQTSIIYGNITHRLEGNPDYSAILPAPSSNSSFDNNHNAR